MNAGALPDTPLYALLLPAVDAVATGDTAPWRLARSGAEFKVAWGTR